MHNEGKGSRAGYGAVGSSHANRVSPGRCSIGIGTSASTSATGAPVGTTPQPSEAIAIINTRKDETANQRRVRLGRRPLE